MSTYLPSIPQPNDNLDFSQGQLLGNFQALDTVYGIDHYEFSNGTANSGFHDQITTPAHIGGEPTTAANLPLIYGLSVGGNLQVAQFAKASNIANTVPGFPLTGLESPAAATSINTGSTVDVFNFTGLARAMCILVASNMGAPVRNYVAYVVWDGTTATAVTISPAILIGFGAVVSTSTILQLSNITGTNMTDVYWSLQFLRVQ